MKEELLREIGATFSDLMETLNSFRQEQIDLVPFEGSWTAGQCTEHVIKASSGVPQVCHGKTESTTRAADEKVIAIKMLFLDFTKKFQSPDFIAPVEKRHNLAQQKSTLEKIQVELTELAKSEDLNPICKDFEVPGFGSFTRYELISFVLIHTQRHTHQLKNIYNSLSTLP